MLSGSPLSSTPLSAFSAAILLSAGAGSFALTGNPATFNPTIVPSDAGSFTLTGQDATFTLARQFGLERGSFLLTGNEAAGVRNGVSSSGTFTLTGQAAGLSKGPILVGAFGEFILTGNQATLSADIRVPQLGLHAVNTLISPTNFATGQLDANTVRSNDNIVAQAVTSHDADDTIHVQSGGLSRRPVSPSEGATWIATDTQDTYLYTGGQWVQIAWAHWYGDFYDTTDQAITTANTAQLVTLNSTGVTRGTSLSNGSRVNVSYAGDYNIMFSVQFRNASADEQDAYLWLKKNGTNIADTAGRVTIPKKHGSEDGHSIAAWNVYATLAANDYVELYVQANSTDVTVETIAAAGSVSRSPSVILTINRI